ncbi:MAG TPA: hypothetical protein VE011_06985 [Candidatus Dormibacteraeota bacterium]|nr:hypothetical protein [Candidatus Dormibacteraeota bacterium]
MTGGARGKVSDIVLGAGDGVVEAYVVEPRDGAARAGVLFLHWLGEHHNDRTQFLSEARELARLGVRSVLPAGRLPWVPDPIDVETDVANIELEQVRLGTALDALVAGPPTGAPVASSATTSARCTGCSWPRGARCSQPPS